MKKILVVLMVAGILYCNCSSNLNDSSNTEGKEPEVEPEPEYTNKFDLAVHNHEKAAWEALGINAYRFTGDVWCGYPAVIFTVTVLPDREPELTYDPEEQELWEEWNLGNNGPFAPLAGSTINELFESIRNHAVNDLRRGDIVKIWYNQEYHYPETYYTSDADISPGGQIHFDITHFEVLEGGGE
jgi:hypothetical protein